MDKRPSESRPRELTDEEIKTVAGGAAGGNGQVPWSQAGGATDPGGWRDKN